MGFNFAWRKNNKKSKTTLPYHNIIIGVPVFILGVVLATFALREFLYPHYYIMASLLLIPALIVIILIFKGAIIGVDQPTDSANTKNE